MEKFSFNDMKGGWFVGDFKPSAFQTKNFDPFKIMVIVFVIVFIFVFSKGIEVLTSPNPNSYSIPYDGPLKSAIEKWLPFSKDK